MATTTNFGWDTPDDTDYVTDGAAAMRELGQDIDTTLVDLKGGTTGQVLSKASNTDMDFTWVAQDDSNAIQNAIVDAKGDLIAASAADTPARLAVGTDGQVLTVDTTTSTGLKWATATNGSLTLLSTTSISGASVTVSSISQSYKNLYIEWEGVTQSADGTFDIQLNATNGAHYSNVPWSAATASNNYNDNVIKLLSNQDSLGTSGNNFGSVTVFNYASTTARKTFMLQSLFVRPTTASASAFGGGGFNSTSAVSSIKFNNTTGNTFNAGTLRIYGVN